MTEVELKASLSPQQAAALPSALARLGFAAQATQEETDLYWNGAARDFRRTDEALRLRAVRHISGGEAQTYLTYKGPKLDARSSTRQEYETAVGDFDTARSILLALGYHAAFTVKKTRRSFTRGAQTVCLDEVDGLGHYIELEQLLEDGASRENAITSLLALLDTLSLSRDALTRASYLELLMARATS